MDCSLPIVRIWAAAAWADGRLHPAEAAALRRLIEASSDLRGDDRQAALASLERGPDLDLAEVRALPREAREGAYRAALGIVVLDHHLADEEKAFLVRLRGALDLDEATLGRIESERR